MKNSTLVVIAMGAVVCTLWGCEGGWPSEPGTASGTDIPALPPTLDAIHPALGDPLGGGVGDRLG